MGPNESFRHDSEGNKNLRLVKNDDYISCKALFLTNIASKALK